MYRHEFEALLESGDVEKMKAELISSLNRRVELADKVTNFERNEIKIDSEGYFDFGCANGWQGFSPAQLIIKLCRQLKHETDGGSTGMKSCSFVRCPVCKYHYWSDSSD